MKFPEVKGSCEWKLAKVKKFTLELDSGKEQVIGLKKIYQKIASPNERVIEIYIFRKCFVARMWVGDVEKFKPVQAQIFKDGKWIDGAKNQSITFTGLTLEGKFCGVSLELKVSPRKTEMFKLFNFF